MCDPLTLGALAIGAAGTAANSIGQAKAQKKQEQEYNQWAQMQSKNRANENARQAEMRGQAEVAREKGVQDISAENQAKLQEAEQQRLAANLAGEGQVTPSAVPSIPSSVADQQLTGQTGGGASGDIFQTELAKKLSDAAASAKQRIGALATINSYGGSWGGLGTVNPLSQQTAGAGIDLENEKRRGSLSAYGVEQAVDPTQISYSNPIADIASSFLGVGMQGLGGMAAGGGGLGGGLAGAGLGKVIGGAVKPSTMGTDPWAGMRTAGRF